MTALDTTAEPNQAAVRDRASRRTGTRDTALDLARLGMAMLVVGAHGHILSDVDPTLFFYTFVGGYARVAIPVFLLISGYFFSIQIQRGVGNWIVHLITLHLFWSAVFAPAWLTNDAFSLSKTVFYLLVGHAHLWFVPAMLGGGLVLYALRKLDSRRLLIAAAALYLSGYAIQTAMNIGLDYPTLDHRAAWDALPRNFLTFGFPFMAIGHVLARPGMLDRVRRWVAPWTFAAVIALYTVEMTVYFLDFTPDCVFELNLTNLVFAPLLFVWLKGIRLSLQARWMAPMSAAIYFSHPLILFALDRWSGHPTAVSLAAMALSFGLGWAILRLSRYLTII